MAQSIHLSMTANGNAIEGESTITSLGRDKTIECEAFAVEVKRAVQDRGLPTGRPELEKLKIVKEVDKSSPLLQKAFEQGEVVEGRFEFFRLEKGTEEHFFTLRIDNARIVGIEIIVDTLEGGSFPVMESVWFAPGEVTYTYESTGAEHTTEFFAKKD